MSLFDEIYFETHELTLQEMWQDYLVENELSEVEFGFLDFLNEM